MIYVIDEASSSNDVARDGRYAAGDIVWVERQTAGRGQRGHAWSGAEGLDLTFSVIAEPSFLPAARQFSLSRAVALALEETFSAFGIAVRIKWTNDIYAGRRKITGVLIENDITSGYISRSVIGIGINVNRRAFDASLPNPTSMYLESGVGHDRRRVLELFADAFGRTLEALRCGDGEVQHRRYDSLLYLLGERAPFSLPDGTHFEGVIRGTESGGRLLVELPGGEVRPFAFGEMEYVLKK